MKTGMEGAVLEAFKKGTQQALGRTLPFPTVTLLFCHP